MESTRRKRWWERIGPGLITACVVIGPGSVLTSSSTGARYGYAMNWVVVVAVLFMMAYTTMSARLGVLTRETTGTIVARHFGRWLSVLIGCAVFFIASAFQFGNNLGVYSALEPFWKSFTSGASGEGGANASAFIPLFVINGVTLLFLFGFQNLYRAVERLMMALVAVMLTAFACNLAFARPDPLEWIQGFIPTIDWPPDIALLGLIGTTFVITAAYYQSYLVKQKGWKEEDVEDSLRDARISAGIMAVITLMIMGTAGAVLRGKELHDVADVARQLEPLFGRAGHAIFCTGLFAAAYSSFLVNSMIGGFILADGLGLAKQPDTFVARLFTAGVLLTGMFVAMFVVSTGARPVGAIVAAQALTVVASPLMAGILLWACNSPKIVGNKRPSVLTNAIAAMGFVVLLAMAGHIAVHRVWPAIRGWITGS